MARGLPEVPIGPPSTRAPGRPRVRSLAVLGLVWTLLGPQAAAAREGSAADALQAVESEREHIVSQMANVKRLLEVSSGAQRVEASNNELAKKVREHGRGLYTKAEQAFAADDHTTAARLLQEAAMSMFQAVRMLGPQDEIVNKKKADFENRATSVNVLLDALNRVAQEQGAQSDAAKTITSVQQTVKGARDLLGQGQHDAARKTLDGGYEMAKVALERLRGGQTLVRSLNFASKEEEYRYELDRNDTHQMLVKVLVQEKRDSNPAIGKMVDGYLEKANALRAKAEQEAGSGDHDAAVNTLELSTKELVRAIRSAGVYIPG